MKEDPVEFEGEVVDHQHNLFFVETTEGNRVTCTLGGKLRLNNIQVVVGDHVRGESTPYDLTKGRIVFRDKSK